MTPAGDKLDRFLTESIAVFKGKRGEAIMADMGGKKLADDLKVALPDLRKAAGALRLRAAAAATAFTTEAKNVERAIKSIEDEADEMRKISNEILGNNPPDAAKV